MYASCNPFMEAISFALSQEERGVIVSCWNSNVFPGDVTEGQHARE